MGLDAIDTGANYDQRNPEGRMEEQFCDEISRERLDWITNVQVLSSESGAQVLSEGLPFIGLTYEANNDSETIVFDAGTGADSYQSHVIEDPTKVALSEPEDIESSTLDIEDASGTKTLITFSRPASEAITT